MTLRLSLCSFYLPYREHRVLHLAILGLLMSAVAFLLVFALPEVAHAAGGVGTGGGPGGGGGGHQSTYGYGWVEYSLSDPNATGPRGGFRDGTSWNAVQAACQGAGTVIAFIVMDNRQFGMIYSYPGWNNPAYLFAPGSIVDGGLATAMSITDARDRFYSLPDYGVDISSYTWGANVAWFCYSFNTPADNGYCIVAGYPATVTPGQSFSATINIYNTGGAHWPTRGINLPPGQQGAHPQRYLLGSGLGTPSTPYDTATWGMNRLELPGTPTGFGPLILSTNSFAQNYGFTAPTAPGTYSFAWRILSDGLGLNLGGCSVNITVSAIHDAGCAMYGVPTTISAGQAFQAYVHFANPVGSGVTWYPSLGYRIGSQNPENNNIWGAGGRLPLTGDIPPGGTSWGGPYNFTAPTTPGTYAFSWRMLREGYLWFGQTCTQNVTVTQPPPTATCSIAPTGSYTGLYEVGRTFSIRITVNRQASSSLEPVINYNGSGGVTPVPLYLTPASGLSGAPPPSQNLNYGTVWPGATGTIDIHNVYVSTPGQYTLRAELRLPSGTVYCSGSAGTTVPIGNKSYLKTFGGDTATGGSFHSNPAACTQPGTGIQAWAEPMGGVNYRGSSAQLTVSALINVNSFYSASQRTANSPAPKGLTFANTGSWYGNQEYGGGSGQTYCLTDYFNDTRDSSLDAGGWNGNNGSLASGLHQYSLNGNNIGASGVVTIPAGTQAAVYVDGNVYIRNNIIYSGAGSWQASPNFILIVRGNIYIAPDVTRLDGRYIAQPDTSGNRGIIYTCAQNGSPFPAAQIFQQCGNKLTINGALIAQNIRFFRTTGSVYNGSVRELPTSPTIAEVMNYTPEMFLAPSPLRRPGTVPGNTSTGITPGNYDSLKALPPVF